MAENQEAPLLSGSPDVVTVGRLPVADRLVATARLLGAKIRTRELAGDPAFAPAAGAGGMSFVFRYGVAVTFAGASGAADCDAGWAPPRDASLDAALAPHVEEAVAAPETETAAIAVRGSGEDRVEPDGLIVLTGIDPDRLELVATVLSRSVVLARDETAVSQAFDHSAPLVADLGAKGRVDLPIGRVMRLVGDVLAARHRVTGTVQVNDRPDLLWDRPELDRLYLRLEAEYEISERAEALDRKLAALGDLGEALLDIVQDKRAFRLEAAIIALIAFEIVLNLADSLLG